MILCTSVRREWQRERKRERKRRKISDGKKSLELNVITGNIVSSQRWYVRSLAYTYREFVNYRLPFYLTLTRKPSHRWDSPYPVARWLQAESKVVSRPTLLSPLFLDLCRSFSSCLIHRLSPFRPVGQPPRLPIRPRSFIREVVPSNEKKEETSAVGVSLLESLFAIVTQRDNSLWERSLL